MPRISPKAKKYIFWITFVIFLGLAITPLVIMYDQIQAEVGYWFSSSNTDSSQVEELGSLTAEELQKFTDGEQDASQTTTTSIDRDEDSIPDYLETTIFQTNPNSKDSDNDGWEDWEEITNGYDPNSHFTERIDNDLDWLKDSWEKERFGTNPKVKDTDQDGIHDGEEIASGTSPLDKKNSRINTDLETYNLKIPKINTSAPIMFTQSRDENAIYEDLKKGYVHYYKTALPGDDGDQVYFCHSSSPAEGVGEYDTVCANLDKLTRGDELSIESETTKIRYTVTSVKNDYNPSDPKIFRKTARKTLSLISCWPAGSNTYRIVVRAEQTSL